MSARFYSAWRIFFSAILISLTAFTISDASDFTPEGEIALVASEFQLKLGAHYLATASQLPSLRQNILGKTERIDPSLASDVYTPPIITSPITNISVEDGGATIMSYNPIYDIAWVFHLKKDIRGDLKTSDVGTYVADGAIVVSGDLLRGEPLKGDGTDNYPKWWRTHDPWMITKNFTQVKSQGWSFEKLIKLGQQEIWHQRQISDERVLVLMEEQIRAAMQDDGQMMPGQTGRRSFPALDLAKKMLTCEGEKTVSDVGKCFTTQAKLATADIMYPKHMDSIAYRFLLGNLYLAATVSGQDGESVAFITSKIPFANKYAIALHVRQSTPDLLMIIPFLDSEEK